MNDIKVKNRRVNKKKALIIILLGITILGVINRTWAYVDEQIKIKAEQEIKWILYGGHEKKRVCLYGIFFCTILTKR